MDKMNKIKNSIQAPDDEVLAAVVNSGIEKRVKELSMKNRMLKGVAGVLCAVVVVSGSSLALNANPAFAASLQEVPVLGAIVRVLTFDHIVENKNNVEVDLTIPKIDGVTDKKLEDIINSEIQKDSNELLKEAREIAAQNEQNGSKMPLSVNSDYKVFNQKDVLSFQISVFTASASGYETNKFYNIDLRSNERLNLASIFKDGVDFKSALNGEIIAQMAKRPGDFFLQGEEGAFTTVSEDTDFYINENGNLVIAFDEYEIAPGSSGAPQFVINKSLLENLLKPEYASIIK